MRTATLAILTALVNMPADGHSGQTPEPEPQALRMSCDKGGSEGPDACLELARLYQEGQRVPRDVALALRLARGACAYNREGKRSEKACFTAFLWGDGGVAVSPGDRETWSRLKDVVQADDPAQRRRLVAESRDLGLLRALLRGYYTEVRALPDYPDLQQATRARVAQLARGDPDWRVRLACVSDSTLSTSLGSNLREEMARSDPQPEVRAAVASSARAARPDGGSGRSLSQAASAADPGLRRAAIQGVEDRPTLVTLARSDPDAEVRSTAVERLLTLTGPERQTETEEVLAQIAAEDADRGVRLAAAAGIREKATLARLAKESRAPEVRTYVVESLDDQETIGWVALHDPDYGTRQAAIRRAEDQVVLRRVATSTEPLLPSLPAESEALQAEAASRLKDQRVLADLAVRERRETICFAAIDALTDQDLLLKVAREATRRHKGDAAQRVVQRVAGRLSDPAAQRSFLRTQPDVLARVNAASRVTDPGLAAEVATTDVAPNVRRMAVTKLADQDLLLRIAQSDADPFVRVEAASRLTDPDVQLELERTTPHADVRYTVAKARMADQGEAVRYARTAKEPGIRRLAAGVVADQAVVAELARGDPDAAVRITAIRRLTDRSVLAEIAGSSARGDVRSAAVRRLKELAHSP